MNHFVPAQYLIFSSAVWHDRFGLNPCELSLNTGSYMAVRIMRQTSCTCLSFVVGIFTAHSPMVPIVFGLRHDHPSASSAHRPTRRYRPYPPRARSGSHSPLGRWDPHRHRDALDRLRQAENEIRIG